MRDLVSLMIRHTHMHANVDDKKQTNKQTNDPQTICKDMNSIAFNGLITIVRLLLHYLRCLHVHHIKLPSHGANEAVKASLGTPASVRHFMASSFPWPQSVFVFFPPYSSLPIQLSMHYTHFLR